MSDVPESQEPGDGLQFDQADYQDGGTAPSLSCGECGRPIAADVYYEVNGAATCTTCHARMVAEREGGNGAGRFLRALVFGGVAGAVGFGIYYGIAKLTGYEFGLIAVLVGFMVGFAVRAGSHSRGGWLYQLMAVGITYLSIVMTYVPLLFEQMAQMDDLVVAEEVGEPAEEEGMFSEAETPAMPESEPAPEVTEPMEVTEMTEVTEVTEVAEADPGGGETDPGGEVAAAPEGLPPLEDMTPVDLVLGSAAFLLLVLALPFLAGFENVLGLLIIGFGLWEAWRLNKRTPFEAAGPFRVGTAPAA